MRFLALRPIQHKTAAKATTGSSELRFAAVAVDVPRVRVVDAGESCGVTVAGEKLQEAPAGNPEQLNETTELKPFTGETVIAIWPLPPAGTVNEPGEAAREKSGGIMIV